MTTILSILFPRQPIALSRLTLVAGLAVCAVPVMATDEKASVPVPAAAQAVDHSGLFGSLDKDNDGRITAAEISETQSTFFRRALRVADANEDGALTATELTVALTDPKPVQIPALGANARAAMQAMMQARASGATPPATAKSPDQPQIKPADRSRSGEKSKSAEMSRAVGKARSADGKSRPAGPDTPPADAATLFDRMDRNGDGKLADDEIPERMKNNISRIDANGDGTVSKAEFTRAVQQFNPQNTPRKKQ